MIYNFRDAQVADIRERKPWLTPEYLLRTTKQTPGNSVRLSIQQVYAALESPQGSARVMSADEIADFCMQSGLDPVAEQQLFADLVIEPGVDF